MHLRGYDEAITVFSPEGRLYQVEYAMEVVRRGSTIIGVTSPEAAVLAAEEKAETPLHLTNPSQKLFQLDEHVGVAAAGMRGDTRVLINYGRLVCQHHRLLYDQPIDLEVLTRAVGNLVHAYTQIAWVRPFGVGLLIAGIDHGGARLLLVDPSGSYKGYRAAALGRGEGKARAFLEDHYKDDLNLKGAIRLVVNALRASSESVSLSDISLLVIPRETGSLRWLNTAELARYVG
jgi:proteasome alpha subunit